VRIRSVVAQAAELRRVSAEASRRHGGGRLAAARRGRRLRVTGSFAYEEALANGQLDPAMPEAVARGFISEHDTTLVLDRLNPESLASLTAEKAIFYRHFAALGVPVPALYGLIGRAGSWSARSGLPLDGLGGAAALLSEEAPEEMVVKPSAGHHGLGVRVLRREVGELVDLEGVRRAPAALARELLDDPEFDLFVVQERLRNHEAIRRLCDAETLQTLRLTTFVSDAGEPELLHGCVKLAFGGHNVDNFRGGSIGNVLVELDVESGVLLRPFSATGTPMPGLEGRRLPDWEAARALALRCAVLLLPQRSMGFDVALTPRGPILVEANRGYDPFPSARFGAAMRAIRRAAAEGGPAVPAGVA
jgi:hypothetical protein